MKKKRPPQPRRVVAVGEPGGAYLSYRPVVEQSNLAVLRHGHVRLPLPLEYRGGRGRQIATPKHKRQSISSESQNATPPPPPRGARAADAYLWQLQVKHVLDLGEDPALELDRVRHGSSLPPVTRGVSPHPTPPHPTPRLPLRMSATDRILLPPVRVAAWALASREEPYGHGARR